VPASVPYLLAGASMRRDTDTGLHSSLLIWFSLAGSS
jgi:hypothetical protein